jgi:hypothetical protein
MYIVSTESVLKGDYIFAKTAQKFACHFQQQLCLLGKYIMCGQGISFNLSKSKGAKLNQKCCLREHGWSHSHREHTVGMTVLR